MILNKHLEQKKILPFFVLMKVMAVLVFIFLQSNAFFSQINLIADPRIEQRIELKNNDQMLGYRVQLCFDSDKNSVDQFRSKFVSAYPKIDTYLRFEAPNFNLMVGDFRTKEEADELIQNIRGQYPLTIRHQVQINLPRID